MPWFGLQSVVVTLTGHTDLMFTCHSAAFDLGPYADPEGGGGGIDLPENRKNIGFLSNSGSDPLKNHEATKAAFNVGPSSARQRNAI